MMKCPYKHPEGTRCPHCADWPQIGPERVSLPPLQGGIYIDFDDEYKPPRRPIVRRVALFGLRVAMVAAGAYVMYAEGQVQRGPGVGFALALGLILGAALIGEKENA